MEHRDLSFTVKRSKRKTSEISIERDGTLTIRIPNELPEEDAKRIIDRKLHWIYSKIEEWKDTNRRKQPTDATDENRESLLYLGRKWKLQADPATLDASVILKGRKIHIDPAILASDQEAFRSAIKAFYSDRGKSLLKPLVKRYSGTIGIETPKIRIIDLGFRWASCSENGHINFNWKCMTLPKRIIEYIVAHEVTHKIVHDHTREFWHKLAKLSPDYQEHEEWLKEHGVMHDLY